MWTLRQTGSLIALLGSLIGCTAFIAYAPPIADLTLAVVASIGWCIWLERHPET